MTVLLLLAACSGGPGPDDGPHATDPTGTCPTGEVLDGETCVPEACGVGTWGNLPVEGDTVYVAAGGAGDGTAEQPFGSIQAALDLAGERGGGLVAVAAGTYLEPVIMGQDHDGVTLAGRCRELVTIDGSDSSVLPMVSLVGDEGGVGVRVEGVRVLEGPRMGIWVWGARATLERVDVTDNVGAGVLVGDRADVTLIDVGVRGSVLGAGADGRGIEVGGGAHLGATGCTVAGNTTVGVIALNAGTTVDLVDTLVLDTAPSPYGSGGGGVWAEDGAALSATGCVVRGNTQVGVAALGGGTTVHLADTVVQDTAPSPDGSGGLGIHVQEGATLVATGCTVEANTEVGVFAIEDATTVELVDTVVTDTAPRPDGDQGWGIGVQDGAALVATGCTVEESTGIGVFAVSEATNVQMVDTEVRDTRRGLVTGFALGVFAQEGATLALRSCAVSGTEGPGVYAVLGAHVSVTSTTLASNSFAGALVLEATVTLDDVTLTDTVPDAQWGGGFGVYATDHFGPPSLTLTRSTLGPHPYAAVWLDGDGTYLLEDNDLSGSDPFDLRGRPIHGNAVFAERGVTAWDGTTGLSLVGNRLHGVTDVAVLLDASSASLDGNTFEGNGVDVWQQRCDGVAQLVSPEPDWVVCDGGTLLTDSATQFTTLYLPEVEPE